MRMACRLAPQRVHSMVALNPCAPPIRHAKMKRHRWGSDPWGGSPKRGEKKKRLSRKRRRMCPPQIRSPQKERKIYNAMKFSPVCGGCSKKKKKTKGGCTQRKGENIRQLKLSPCGEGDSVLLKSEEKKKKKKKKRKKETHSIELKLTEGNTICILERKKKKKKAQRLQRAKDAQPHWNF
ncbi:hypothetical protein PVNG_01890 [Plasmodium vivax North Korean]|uniref:Uncharacterized protein n=1 Tax=Plasmodium vivax North Korean TaxID=1035514 RepID=A0A0J9U2T4_PLAVI|nr:hypothetical protein PVNG_01890 [Plasmodium vivax North Korean]